MDKNEKKITACPVGEALKVIKGKWSLLIAYEIGHDKKRFGELKRGIADISEKMLIQELKRMVSADIIHRKAYPEIPPRVEYSLTEKGKKLLPILAQIEAFGLELLEENI